MAKHQNFNLIKIKSQNLPPNPLGNWLLSFTKKKKHFFWISIFFHIKYIRYTNTQKIIYIIFI